MIPTPWWRLAWGRARWMALRVTHRLWCPDGEWLADIDGQYCAECDIYRRLP